MKIERQWKTPKGKKAESWYVIDEEQAARELANAHGAAAVAKLQERGTLETQYGRYRLAAD